MNASINSHFLASCWSIAILALLAGAAIADGQEYTAVELFTTPPPFHGSGTYAYAINDAGTVVGDTGDDHIFSYSNGTMVIGGPLGSALGVNDTGTIVGTTLNKTAFSSSNGTTTYLGSLDGGPTSASAINSAGTIVGTSYFGGGFLGSAYIGGTPYAFIYSNGTMTNLGALIGGSSSASAINNAGTIVGSLLNPGGTNSAFSYSNGTMTSLGTLGGTNSIANAINDAGMIVGDSTLTNSSSYHAFVFSNGTMRDIGTLGGSNSAAFGINSNGIIVGSSDTAGGNQDAFVYNNGSMIDLNTLVNLSGVTLTDAVAINAAGLIAANGSDGDAFLLIPIPEPSAYAVVLGITALGLAAVRRRRMPA